MLFLFVFLLNLSGISQTYYHAIVTEMYTIDPKTEQWVLYQKNSDVNIPVIFDGELIKIQAKTPCSYLVSRETKEPIKTETLSGYRYDAIEIKTNKDIIVDLVKSRTTDLILLSIINPDIGYNLRYFLVEFK